MFSKRKYVDGGDGHEMGLKRPHLFDSGSSYFGVPSSSGLMYNASYAYSGEPPPFPVVRLRGLPFDCTEADIIDFLHGLDLLDILFIHKSGRFTGEAYCVLAYPLQVDFAIQRDRRNMGRRYVEVFRSSRQEYYSAIANELSDMRGGSPRRVAPRVKSNDEGKDLIEHTGILRMRGLPYSAGKEDIMDFFKDYELSEERIYIVLNAESRPSGEAYVEFANAVASRSAMAKDRMTLGRRYIELFPSTTKEMDDALSKEDGCNWQRMMWSEGWET
ncbi:epithelial splicing regulatory protein 2 isoform X2 [Phalaenopsis equestris]|uniref:epithelial splicing regulatory protein 2 isoform X2 n=1 Tax=Phalaenopsis equestris TaxID=78828 RepID=UPI0009E2AF52|nr:epithelial splicing regulatory protein 2 isoform X2 [Phalaenopsis equestris]